MVRRKAVGVRVSHKAGCFNRFLQGLFELQVVV